MFKLNQKKHNLRLCHTKKCKEENTSTKRLYNSAIPFMQRTFYIENKETEHILGKYKVKKT